MGAMPWMSGLLRRRAPPPEAAADPPPPEAAAHPPPVPRPLHADWAWRPDPWARPLLPARWAQPAPGTRLSPEVALYHDCPGNAVDVAQDPGAGPPFALMLLPGGFGGRFLSLAVDLPDAALSGLGPGHILALDVRCDGGLPPGSVARLNLRQGAAERRLMRGLPQGLPFEFDLVTLPPEDGAVTAGWVDLIFGAPLAAPVRIADLTLSRRPRAEP